MGEENRVLNIFTFLPFLAQPVDRRKKYLQNRCSYVRRIYTQKNWTSILISDGENRVSPKPDRQTDI